MLALLILGRRVSDSEPATRKAVYKLYLAHTQHINNWDLVDASAPEIVGGYLVDKSRQPLHRLAASSNMWERRISIVATHHFIRRNDFGPQNNTGRGIKVALTLCCLEKCKPIS